MQADLHAHYPMHLVPGFGHSTFELITSRRARARLLDRVRGRLVGLAGRVANYESFSAGPRVTVPLMREGGVGVAFSVLHSPFDEMDLALRYGSPPLDRYFPTLLRQLEAVESEVARDHVGFARVVHDRAELERALTAGETALVHCVEGGYHLGETPRSVDANVTKLAAAGVAYITLAHLFWRQVATNVNAIPFLPDTVYGLLFPQPDVGLAELGRAAVRAMARERVLVDLSHMTERAMADTFSLLDELAPDAPVIASHVGYRFGLQDYNLREPTVRRIARRGGVIGVILAEHQAADGLRRRHTRDFEQSFEIVCRHLDRIREVTGSHEHSAIGTDLDGFIKPTLAGLGDSSRLGRLTEALRRRYGRVDGERIASGNVLRLLREYWRPG